MSLATLQKNFVRCCMLVMMDKNRIVDTLRTRLSLHAFIKYSWLVLLLSLVVYVIVFLVGVDSLHMVANYLVILPVLTAGLCFGFRGGLVVGVMGLPTNMLFLWLLGHPEWEPDNEVIAESAILLIGVGSGLLRDYFSRLQAEIRRYENAEARLEVALRQKDILYRELQHRVKNNLATIRALVRMQARRSSDKAFIAAMDTLSRRIRMVADIHDQLYGSRAIVSVEPGPWIETLVRTLVYSSVSDPAVIKLVFAIVSGIIPVETANAVGFAVNEVVTNSLKHAFGEAMKGTITVAFGETPETWELEISDNGRGFSSGEGRHTGLGMDLVASFAAKLRATFDWNSGTEGTVFRMSIPKEDNIQVLRPYNPPVSEQQS